jgi:hypothetical protein
MWPACTISLPYEVRKESHGNCVLFPMWHLDSMTWCYLRYNNCMAYRWIGTLPYPCPSVGRPRTPGFEYDLIYVNLLDLLLCGAVYRSPGMRSWGAGKRRWRHMTGSWPAGRGNTIRWWLAVPPTWRLPSGACGEPYLAIPPEPRCPMRYGRIRPPPKTYKGRNSKVVEMHTWSLDWKRVSSLIIFSGHS